MERDTVDDHHFCYEQFRRLVRIPVVDILTGDADSTGDGSLLRGTGAGDFNGPGTAVVLYFMVAARRSPRSRLCQREVVADVVRAAGVCERSGDIVVDARIIRCIDDGCVVSHTVSAMDDG